MLLHTAGMLVVGPVARLGLQCPNGSGLYVVSSTDDII